MLQFILRRLVLLLPVLVGILLFTFIITRMIKGDPCVVMLGEKATKQQCDMFKERYGLNDNVLVQFGRYILNIAQGDFGTTIKDRRPVVDVMAERLPMTIEITVGAMLFSTTFGVLLGIFAALRRNSALDVGTMMVANVGVSMPVFWLGQILAYTFALLLKGTIFYLPPSSRLSASMSLVPLATLWHLDNLGGLAKFLISMISNSAILNGILTGNFLLVKDALWHLILPCAAVGTIPMAIIARMTRSSLLDVLGQDYVRTARAKGLVQRLVVTRHALRNALIPIVTIIGLETGVLLSGAVLTETIFSLPGVGTRMVDAILSRDYPVIQGFTILIALIFVVTNLVVDISYAFLDPRIRLE
jgi:ABC-type dipeptide/oligopeptide/nickel transport system permease component